MGDQNYFMEGSKFSADVDALLSSNPSFGQLMDPYPSPFAMYAEFLEPGIFADATPRHLQSNCSSTPEPEHTAQSIEFSQNAVTLDPRIAFAWSQVDAEQEAAFQLDSNGLDFLPSTLTVYDRESTVSLSEAESEDEDDDGDVNLFSDPGSPNLSPISPLSPTSSSPFSNDSTSGPHSPTIASRLRKRSYRPASGYTDDENSCADDDEYGYAPSSCDSEYEGHHLARQLKSVSTSLMLPARGRVPNYLKASMPMKGTFYSPARTKNFSGNHCRGLRKRASSSSLSSGVVKKYDCTICGKKFRRSEHLKRHNRSLHSEDKPYECFGCGKHFSRGDNMRQHARIHEKEKWAKCP